MNRTPLIILLAAVISTVSAREYHVASCGDDSQPGTASKPLRTVSAAAQLAQPGDTIAVHEGVYRERINPPRGGLSDRKRIVYQAARGEKVVFKGSEVIKGWRKEQNDTWTVTIPNNLFGNFNPYSDLIRGDWFEPKGRNHHTGAVYLNDHWLTEAATLEEVLKPVGNTPLWFGKVDGNQTTLWAQFKGVDPNTGNVEINVRQTVFYPSQPGINYLTVRGFTMMHAATPWAPPTAEQIGLIGTHWSKGWIIENNDIRYSTCVGIALGKHGDQYDNTSQNSAEGYVKTIERALAKGWSKENIGHHVVRNNHIAHCEQAGIVGSLGAIFSQVTRNEIHDIHIRQLFTGAEMAGIKFHAAIDTEISHNHIYRCVQGIWLDWMTQGTRVTRNVLHDNHWWQDLFVEVNHGPFMVDHNLFLSQTSLLDVSEGGTYVHNLFAGKLKPQPELNRDTPYHPAHCTTVAGLRHTKGGDNRFINNLFVGQSGLQPYDGAALPMRMAGNVFLKGATPSKNETSPVVLSAFDPGIKLVEEKDGFYLHIDLDQNWVQKQSHPLVTTDLLGKAMVSDLPYVQPDGSPYRLKTDFLGNKRKMSNPFPGPFEPSENGSQLLKVWPMK
ncbi:MAG TPA: right-handed parallel beta-helix repeat-containing protein [Clostridia bacterium]|nr:right-handed parallel beta-helix repeat-containing protein [Clostridia bacterium]